MDNNQTNTNNPMDSGITGFGTPPANSMPGNANNMPPVAPQPTPAAPPAFTQPAQTSSIMPNVPEVAQPAPAPIQQNPAPMNPPVQSDFVENTQNFSKQTIVGGVETPPVKQKTMFSMPSKMMPHTDAEPVADQNVSATPAPAYNEITASGSKSKFALIAIIAGVVLLVLAGGGYYYLMVLNKPEPIEPESQPIVEQPTLPVVDASQDVDQDPYILNLSQLEATVSAEPSELKNHIKSINVDSVDAEFIVEMPKTQESPVAEPEPDEPLQ